MPGSNREDILQGESVSPHVCASLSPCARHGEVNLLYKRAHAWAESFGFQMLTAQHQTVVMHDRLATSPQASDALDSRRVTPALRRKVLESHWGLGLAAEHCCRLHMCRLRMKTHDKLNRSIEANDALNSHSKS